MCRYINPGGIGERERAAGRIKGGGEGIREGGRKKQGWWRRDKRRRQEEEREVEEG